MLSTTVSQYHLNTQLLNHSLRFTPLLYNIPVKKAVPPRCARALQGPPKDLLDPLGSLGPLALVEHGAGLGKARPGMVEILKKSVLR